MANAPMRVFISRSHVETLLRYGVSSEHVDVTDVNVIHVLYEYICHRLYTRMRAWVYVYLPGSGAPESASARRAPCIELGQPFLAFASTAEVSHEKKETHNKRLLVSAPPLVRKD